MLNILNSKKVEVNCPYSLCKVSSNEGLLTNCGKCNKSFIFFECYQCGRNIYFRNKSRFDEYMRIECPYIDCRVKYIKSKCISCEKRNYTRINDKSVEEYKHKCVHCNREYKNSICPIEKCNEITKINASNNNIPPDTEITPFITCKSCDYVSIQIICIFCNRYIVYEDGNLIEGQKIICPYPDCMNVYSYVYCLKCKEMIIFNKGCFSYGDIIECYRCLCIFSVVFCPDCLMIYKTDQNLEGKKLICNNNKCLISFCFVNCLYCRNINLWHDNSYIPGQIIVCSYCHKSFNKVICPSCDIYNVYYNNNFEFGRNYICINENCKAEKFSFFICPYCRCSNYSTEYTPGDVIKCGNCANKYINITCVYCNSLILELGGKYTCDGYVICPCCDGVFIFSLCLSCRKGLYFKVNDTERIYTFPDELHIQCECSSEIIIYTGNKNKELIEIRQRNVYNFVGIEYIQGRKFRFSNPIKHYIEEENEGLLIKNNNVYSRRVSSNSIPSLNELLGIGNGSDDRFPSLNELLEYNKCIICIDRQRQAVFVPCGHKYCCCECAKNIYETKNICPICNSIIEKILDKVFD